MFGVGLLGLSWSAVELKKGTERIERAIVEVRGRPEWSDGNNARSSRTIPIDPAMVRHTPSIADSK